MASSDLLTINPGDGFFFTKEKRPWLVTWGGTLAGSKASVTVPEPEDKSHADLIFFQHSLPVRVSKEGAIGPSLLSPRELGKSTPSTAAVAVGAHVNRRSRTPTCGRESWLLPQPLGWLGSLGVSHRADKGPYSARREAPPFLIPDYHGSQKLF